MCCPPAYGPELVQPVSGSVRGATAVDAPAAVNPFKVMVRGLTATDAPAAVKPASEMVRGDAPADAPAAVKPATAMVRGVTITDEPLAVKPASVIVRGDVPSVRVAVLNAPLIGDTTAPDNTVPLAIVAVPADGLPLVVAADAVSTC